LVHVLDSAPVSKKGRDVSNNGPIVLVLAPTRELAMQSAEVAEKAAAAVQLNTCCIYGGVDRYQQRAELAKGIHVMVATPGRLLSLIKDGEISLARVTFLVLDEADRMLDLGFEPDIRALVGYCPDSQKRQTLMFSATWPEIVRKLADAFIVDPLRIVIGKDESELANDTLAANKRIVQSVEVIDEFKRDARLQQIMSEHTKGAKDHKKILVFVLYKKEVDKVANLLRNKGYNAVGMSSDKTQAERVAAIENFKSGKVRVLVATDVAGRGLDINDIALVVNYSFPLTVEDYVHRIGRTGRGGKEGESITFFTKNDKGLSGELINVLREAGSNVPEDLMKFGTGVKRKTHGMYGDFYKSADERPMKAAVKVTFD
jgi:ATP-dependent RNA helicase DBP3